MISVACHRCHHVMFLTRIIRGNNFKNTATTDTSFDSYEQEQRTKEQRELFPTIIVPGLAALELENVLLEKTDLLETIQIC